MFRRGPTAKAFRLLKELDPGPTLRQQHQAHLILCKGDASNDDSRWVDTKDEISLSLLQAQLIDLKLRSKLRKEFEGPT